MTLFFVFLLPEKYDFEINYASSTGISSLKHQERGTSVYEELVLFNALVRGKVRRRVGFEGCLGSVASATGTSFFSSSQN